MAWVPPASAYPGVPRRTTRRAGVFLASSLALFCIQLDFFALDPAVPGISEEPDTTVSAAQWTLSAYMLAVGCLFTVGGRLGDLLGRRPVLLAGTGLFAAASVGCALAPDLGVLVAARTVQGAGAALIFPVSVSVITNAFPEATRARPGPGGSACRSSPGARSGSAWAGPSSVWPPSRSSRPPAPARPRASSSPPSSRWAPSASRPRRRPSPRSPRRPPRNAPTTSPCASAAP
ncbi:MFS transporter [Streptomyces qaidamensis]|uniref:MFS transporter n=1 Tax=Streptomyces qaidamensis TaxID=1783515 RepID=UPI000D17FFF8|nr:MFS transporter [Streptomyces qaidamensis]